MGRLECERFEEKGRGGSEIYVEMALSCSIRMGRFWERGRVALVCGWKWLSIFIGGTFTFCHNVVAYHSQCLHPRSWEG